MKRISGYHSNEWQQWHKHEFDWPEYEDSISHQFWVDKEVEVLEWLCSQESPGRFLFDDHYGVWYFENEQDLMMMVLRWA